MFKTFARPLDEYFDELIDKVREDYANSERLLAEHDKAKVQKAMVRDSLTRAFDELHSVKVHHDARKLRSYAIKKSLLMPMSHTFMVWRQGKLIRL